MRKELIVYNDPKSPVSEMFKTLRTNIQFMNSDKELKTLLVSSTLPGEGKSWTAANLAVTFAQAGKKVLIIDADMRKGRQFSIFGISPTPGLSNYLSGVVDGEKKERNLDEFVQKTDIENLYVMPAGNVPPNPSELLVSEKMIELNKKVKELYDITIFDGTPSLLVTDAPILSRIVDSTILVTAHNETKIDNVARVKKSIENVGGKVAGVVVNKIPVSASKYEGTYYYGGYGSTAPIVINEKQSKHSKTHFDFFWNKKAKFDSIEEKINKIPFKYVQETEKNENEETEEDKAIEDTIQVENNQETQNYITNEEIKPVQNIEPEIPADYNNISEINTNIEDNNINAENITTPESMEDNISNFEDYNTTNNVATIDEIQNNDIAEIKEEKVEVNNVYNNYTIDNEITNNKQTTNQYNNIYNEVKEDIATETEENENRILSTTQDVIDQINKYLEEERRKLKNGGLND
ncbi:MAG: polysaccharide biosynthesis tyrosine autokinase [Clostridia bacterium]|nr:polysaccharide biosynthesis tyrosine autokinase [Clostridia bacterium]